MQTEVKKVMCPSSTAKAGAELLGIRQEDGTMAILPKTIPVKEEFVEITKQGTPAEQRFRFTNKCVESACKQWNGKGCGIAEEVIKFLDQLAPVSQLPECGIRPNCRWYLQKGEGACHVCPYVVTDLREEL